MFANQKATPPWSGHKGSLDVLNWLSIPANVLAVLVFCSVSSQRAGQMSLAMATSQYRTFWLAASLSELGLLGSPLQSSSDVTKSSNGSACVDGTLSRPGIFAPPSLGVFGSGDVGGVPEFDLSSQGENPVIHSSHPASVPPRSGPQKNVSQLWSGKANTDSDLKQKTHVRMFKIRKVLITTSSESCKPCRLRVSTVGYILVEVMKESLRLI